jgi:Sulfotransferase domain
MKQPNFFIIGAPKCGTTALFQYLSEHPNVFACEPKEPHYFATDIPGMCTINTEKAYFDLFKDATEQHLAIGDASVFYMYSREAVLNIKRLDPNAKLIVMLRHPVELVHSMHSQVVYSRDEHEMDFEKAWELIPLRKRGEALSKFTRDAKTLMYDEIAKLGEQLGRVLNTFPKEQVMVIFFEDFKKDTAGVYRKTLEFLGLPFHTANLEPVNQNKKQRLQWLADFTERPPQILVNPYLQLKKVLGLEGKVIGLKDPLQKVNVVEMKRETLSPAMQQKIIDTYRADIQKLSKLTGRNLDHWLIVK